MSLIQSINHPKGDLNEDEDGFVSESEPRKKSTARISTGIKRANAKGNSGLSKIV